MNCHIVTPLTWTIVHLLHRSRFQTRQAHLRGTIMLSLDPILNLFVGLALTFGSFSLLASSITEAVASAMGWRAATLEQGLKALLNDPKLEGYAKDVLAHAAVNPLSPGLVGDALATKRPTYIEPSLFAAALTDVLHINTNLQQTGETLKTAIGQVTNPQLKQFLSGLEARAQGNVDEFRAGLAGWFDSAMDRLSGTYKRKVQFWNFAIAAAMAVVMNVDALHIAHQLWVQPGLTGFLSQTVQNPDYPKLYAVWSQSFPFGWQLAPAMPQTGIDQSYIAAVFLMVLGWLITASSTFFGAPFWFDQLQRIARIRSTGPSPREANAARGGNDGQAVVSAGLQVGAAASPPVFPPR
jgi:hypothetical protein